MVPSEKARASMPPTTDVVAPQEHPTLSECAVNHGLERHGCIDGDSEALSPCPTAPILLPEEWLAAYQTLSDITSQSLNQTSTHPPIIPGCASFASCIDLSRAYAVKVDIDAIESTATTLLAAGKGIDHDVMSDHMDRIQQMGMSAALLSFSGQTLPTTLHPRPHLVVDPPPRHSPLPVRPHASLVTHLSEEQKSSLMAHQARLPTPPPVDPPLELEVMAETQCTLGQFTLSMSFEERLHGLAVEGDAPGCRWFHTQQRPRRIVISQGCGTTRCD